MLEAVRAANSTRANHKAVFVLVVRDINAAACSKHSNRSIASLRSVPFGGSSVQRSRTDSDGDLHVLRIFKMSKRSMRARDDSPLRASWGCRR